MSIEIVIWAIIAAVSTRTAAYAVYTIKTKNVCGGVFLWILSLLCIAAGLVCFT